MQIYPVVFLISRGQIRVTRGIGLLVKKAVIPAAGMGTRLLPATKEQPKEMLPVFARSLDGQSCLNYRRLKPAGSS